MEWNVPGKYGPHGELFFILIQKEPATVPVSEIFSPFFNADIRVLLFSADVLKKWRRRPSELWLHTIRNVSFPVSRKTPTWFACLERSGPCPWPKEAESLGRPMRQRVWHAWANDGVQFLNFPGLSMF